MSTEEIESVATPIEVPPTPVVCSMHIQVPDGTTAPDAKAVLDALKRSRAIPNDAVINVSVQVVVNSTPQTASSV